MQPELLPKVGGIACSLKVAGGLAGQADTFAVLPRSVLALDKETIAVRPHTRFITACQFR
jgi:hypothetical protein